MKETIDRRTDKSTHHRASQLRNNKFGLKVNEATEQRSERGREDINESNSNSQRDCELFESLVSGSRSRSLFITFS